MAGTSEAAVEFVRVPVDSVEPNDWNPNEMADETFNELAEDLAKEDLDQPVIVVENPDKKGSYIIVDGEHRWRGQKAAGHETVPVVIRAYNPLEQMAATMRRNMLRGQTNPVKFTKLVKRMQEQSGVPLTEIRKRMAVTEKDFGKLYRATTDEDKKAAAQAQKNSESNMQIATMVANLSTMVREIILEWGDTIKYGFVYFAFKGKKHLLISMDQELRKQVEQFVAQAKDSGAGADVMAKKLTDALKQVNATWQ